MAAAAAEDALQRGLHKYHGYACADWPLPRVCDEARARVDCNRKASEFVWPAWPVAAARLRVLFAMYPHGGVAGGGGVVGGKRRIRFSEPGARIVPVVLFQGVRLRGRQAGERAGRAGRAAGRSELFSRQSDNRRELCAVRLAGSFLFVRCC